MRKNVWLILGILVTIGGGLWFARPPERPRVETEVTESRIVLQEAKPTPSISKRAQLPFVASSDGNSGLSLEIAKFRELAVDVLRALPVKQDLKNLNEHEVHDTPKILLEAGKELGRVAEILNSNPRLIKEGAKFYRSCVGTAKFPSSVRALCLFHHSRMRTQLAGEGVDIAGLDSEQNIPSEIRELAHLLGEK